MICIGIDPGNKNTGLGYINEEGEFLQSIHIVPDDLGFNEAVDYIFENAHSEIGVVTIERYVSYGQPQTAAAEKITMLIGAIAYKAEQLGASVYTFKAFDWKVGLCKYLYKTKGFENPSQSLDKKFSLAAAECITGIKFKTDHEADAVCLAYYGRLQNENKTRQKSTDQGKT